LDLGQPPPAPGSPFPLAIDLCCGLGGWTEGLQQEGWTCIGFDIVDHRYGPDRYPGQLVLQDVTSLDGAQLRHASLIVASPPCQFFSYTAMPWKRAKALAQLVRADPDRLAQELAIWRACLRLQREASAAAGRRIPLVIENVQGAIPWVGRSNWNHGSYHLWGDVPALMPIPAKRGGGARKNPGFRFDGQSHRSFQSESVDRHVKGPGGAWFAKGAEPWTRDEVAAQTSNPSSHRRKAASARIAKIPLTLSRWIGRTWLPRSEAA
jgi:hypothetical protein